MKVSIIAVLIALTLAFASKPKEWTTLQCFYDPHTRDVIMVQALQSMILGGENVTGWQAVDRNGLYCFEIYTLRPI